MTLRAHGSHQRSWLLKASKLRTGVELFAYSCIILDTVILLVLFVLCRMLHAKFKMKQPPSCNIDPPISSFSCWNSKFSSWEHVLIFFKADKVEQVSGETQMIPWKGRRVCQWLWPLWQEIARKILGINMVANLCGYIYYLMPEK